MKAKPLFLFMHLLFQHVVEYPPKVPLRDGKLPASCGPLSRSGANGLA